MKKALTAPELALLASLLDSAGDKYAVDGGTSLELENTPANRELASAVLNHDNESDDEDDQFEVKLHRGKICLDGESLCSYFQARAQALAAGAETTTKPPVTAVSALPVVSDPASDVQLFELVAEIKAEFDGQKKVPGTDVWCNAHKLKYPEPVVRRAEALLAHLIPGYNVVAQSQKTTVWRFGFFPNG